MVEAYAGWVLRWRWAIMAATLVVVLVTASGARFLDFSNDYRIFFSKENPQLAAFETLQNTYAKNDSVLIVLAPEDGDVFSRETLAAVADVTDKAWHIPYSVRVDSLTNFQHTYADGDDLTVVDLVDDSASLTDEMLAAVRRTALGEPLLVQKLVSLSGAVTAVNVTVELPGLDKAHEVPQVVNKAREIAAHVETTYPSIKVYMTGVVMLNNAFAEAAERDMERLLPLAFAAILIAVLLQLRGFAGTFGTLLVILFSVASAMGVAGWLGLPLTAPLMSAPTIILTLSVADCVHVLTNWMQGLRNGTDRREAMVESLRINLFPVFLTSATTAIGFLSLNFSEAPPFHHLGNVSAVGVMMAFVFAISFLPALMVVLPSKVKAREVAENRCMLCLANWVIRHRGKLLAGMGAGTLALLTLVPLNETTDVFVRYFDKNIRFRSDTDFVEKNLTGIYFVDYSLDSGEEGGIAEPRILQQIEALANWLRAQPEVIHVSSITDIMKRLNKNLHGDDDTWYRLPEQRDLAAQYLLLYEMSLPYGLDLNNQIDVAKRATRLSATLKTISSNAVLEFEHRVYDWMQANTPGILTHGASPTIMFSHIGYRNIRSMLMGTLFALLLISVLLMVALKSWRYGLVSLLPNLVPAGMAFGVWGLINGEVGLGVSVVTAMTLGIVVDDTVHFMSKYLRARRERGLSAEDAVRYAFKTVGVALWITSLALVAGFLVLSTSSFVINGAMGLLVSIVITLALVADFFLLPPLLMRLDGWLKDGEAYPVPATDSGG